MTGSMIQVKQIKKQGVEMFVGIYNNQVVSIAYSAEGARSQALRVLSK